MITIKRFISVLILFTANAQAFIAPYTPLKSLKTITTVTSYVQKSPYCPNCPQSCSCVYSLNPFRIATKIPSRWPFFRPQSSFTAVDSCVAAFTILLSSFIGMMSERKKLFGGDAGTVLALTSAALMSNLGIFGLEVPTHHPIYDICWTRLLPSSLALFLMSYSNSIDDPMPRRSSTGSNWHEGNSSTNNSYGDNIRRRLTVVACGIPFIIGSIGSALGCFCSAFIMARFSSRMPTLFRMQPYEAAVAAGCLSASYIGGSVNFFATANIISSQMTNLFPTTSTQGFSDLISAMATADLIVMAVYFLMLSAMLSWKRLQQTFPGRQLGTVSDDRSLSLFTNQVIPLQRDMTEKSSDREGFIFSGTLAALISFIIAEMSVIFEKRMSFLLPGLGCAAVSVLGISLGRVLDSILIRGSNRSSLITKSLSKFKSDLAQIGGPISRFYFMALFAAIGTSANLSKVLTQGVSTFMFALITLFIHFVTLGAGSFLSMKLLPLISKRTNFIFPLAIEEVLVASNAAIGGASTAAGFAGNISEDRIDNTQKRALIIAATFWGIVGYASATAVGVFVTKMLAAHVIKCE